MGRGRVGGTRSRISGKVGNEVFLVHKNADGSYSQVVQAVPESREDVLTPEKARQRCYMSVIMSHMPLLTDFMSAAFDGVDNGTLSVQEFVRQNIRLIQDEVDGIGILGRAWWYRYYGDNNIYPEPLLISDGSFNPRSGTYSHQRSGMNGFVDWFSDDTFKGDTLGRVFNRWNFYPGEYIVIIFFIPKNGDVQSHYEYTRYRWKDNLDPDKLIVDYAADALFDFSGTFHVNVSWRWDVSHDGNMIRYASDNCPQFRYVGAFGILQFGFKDGRRRISRCRLRSDWTSPEGDLTRHLFDDVWDSWYTDRL